MLQKLSIMLLSTASKITYSAFKKCPLFPKLCHLFMTNNYHFKLLAYFLIPTHTYDVQNYAGIIAASLK